MIRRNRIKTVAATAVVSSGSLNLRRRGRIFDNITGVIGSADDAEQGDRPVLRELHDSALIELGDQYIVPPVPVPSPKVQRSVRAWKRGLANEPECLTYLHSKPLPSK